MTPLVNYNNFSSDVTNKSTSELKKSSGNHIPDSENINLTTKKQTNKRAISCGSSSSKRLKEKTRMKNERDGENDSGTIIGFVIKTSRRNLDGLISLLLREPGHITIT